MKNRTVAPDVAVSPPCADEVCAPWLMPVPDPTFEGRTFRLFHTPEYVRIVEQTSAPSRERPSARAPNEWIEVTRRPFRAAFEGVNGYGCWFYPAVGAGTWVSVGRAPISALHKRHLDARIVRYAEARGIAVPKPDGIHEERFPAAAWKLNISSVFISDNYEGTPELVVTSPSCAEVRPRLPQLGTCPPADIELRTGSAHEKECLCAEGRRHLNCIGNFVKPL